MERTPNKNRTPRLKFEEVERHRNGICGEPFYAVIFNDEGNRMLGIVFDEPGHCAVVQLNQPGDFTVAFGTNSWRGDHYEPALRAAIRRKEKE